MSGRDLESRAAEVLVRLERRHVDAEVELHFRNPLELLIATILSAQSTDRRVNRVTPGLFKRYPGAAAFAAAGQAELEEAIHSTGFFRQKARNIRAACQMLVDRHGGEVPTEMADLVALPGVGRKTANVIRAVAFDLPGIAVDTHCRRVSSRLGLTTNHDPAKIEADLGGLYPPSQWADVSRLFIWHGRYVCKARKPACEDCPLPDLCPWFADEGGDRD